MNATSTLRLALYAQGDPTATASQLRGLRQLARDRGFTVAGEYVDAVPGRRHEMERLAADLRAGRIDVVVCTSLVRLATTVRALVSMLADFTARGIHIVTADAEIDTMTPEGRCKMAGIASLATVERALQRERGEGAVAACRRRGQHVGRGRAVVDLPRALALRREGRERSRTRAIPEEPSRSSTLQPSPSARRETRGGANHPGR